MPCAENASFPQCLVDVVAAAGAAICPAPFAKPCQRVVVVNGAAGLPLHRFVRSQAQPIQLLQDELGRLWAAPRGVGVFDPHEPGSAVRPCVQVAGQCGHHRACMQRTRRCGGKTPTIGDGRSGAHGRAHSRVSKACRVVGLASCVNHHFSARPSPAAAAPVPARQA